MNLKTCFQESHRRTCIPRNFLLLSERNGGRAHKTKPMKKENTVLSRILSGIVLLLLQNGMLLLRE